MNLILTSENLPKQNGHYRQEQKDYSYRFHPGQTINCLLNSQYQGQGGGKITACLKKG